MTELNVLSLLPLHLLQLEEYDMMVRELGFEMKAQPSEKMKTPEELAREEREKLQKLEVCNSTGLCLLLIEPFYVETVNIFSLFVLWCLEPLYDSRFLVVSLG